MLPVVSGREYTALNILVYTLALVALTLVFAITSAVGWVYLGVAAPPGGLFIVMAWQLRRNFRPGAPELCTSIPSCTLPYSSLR